MFSEILFYRVANRSYCILAIVLQAWILTLLISRNLHDQPIWRYSLAVGSIVLLILHLSSECRSNVVPKLIYMTLIGWLGFLVGLWVDFGPLGLLLLADLCTVTTGGVWGNVVKSLNIAPSTHMGMFIGCNVGMMMGCTCSVVRKGSPASYLFRLLLLNVGMWGGMIVLESIRFSDLRSGYLGNSTVLILKMFIGMNAGMLLVSLLLSYAGKMRCFWAASNYIARSPAINKQNGAGK